MIESGVQRNHREVEFDQRGKGRGEGRRDQDEDDVPPSDPFLFLFSDPIMKSACCYKKLDKPSIFAGIYTLVSSKNFITIFSLSLPCIFFLFSLPLLNTFFFFSTFSLSHSTIFLAKKCFPN